MGYIQTHTIQNWGVNYVVPRRAFRPPQTFQNMHTTNTIKQFLTVSQSNSINCLEQDFPWAVCSWGNVQP